MNRHTIPFKFVTRIVFVLTLCFFAAGCFPRLTESDMKEGSPTIQKILISTEDIRKLVDGKKNDRKDKTAKLLFESGLSTWRASHYYAKFGPYFDQAPSKLFDAYIGYLTEAKKISPAIDTLRIAIEEADKSYSYKTALRYRLDLAEALAHIGQIEAAQNSLAEAQGRVDRVFGVFSADNKNIDPFQLADNAALLLVKIRLGISVDPAKLASFADIYAKTLKTDNVLKFIGIETPFESLDRLSSTMNEREYYRRDQEYWRWFAVGALRAGDKNLAKKSLHLMLEASEKAEPNKYAIQLDDMAAKSARINSYILGSYFNSGKHSKQFDVFFGLETKFDSALAAAEIYLMLDEPVSAHEMIARAKEALPVLTTYSDELKAQGHLGLRSEQRSADLLRITGKLLLKNRRWREALLQLDQYIAWSEAHRNNLTLEERLPYFRSQVQGAYFDALLAKASLYTDDPTEANFIGALEALGNLKARHLRDSLDAGGKIKNVKEHSIKNSLAHIVKDNQGFLSITDMGEKLLIFFADRDGKKIRITDKPKDFDKTIRSFRNNLAEQQNFDAPTARLITTLTLGDLEPRIFSKQRLVVEMDGSLSFLPIELWLNTKMVYLGRATAVTYIPSLAIADIGRTSTPVKGILALGDARFDQNLQISAIGGTNEYATRGKRDSVGFLPLPETRDEVISIIQSVREGGKAILGQEATKKIFFQEAHVPYRYMHFATHGVVGGEIPRLNEPALVLTPDGCHFS